MGRGLFGHLLVVRSGADYVKAEAECNAELRRIKGDEAEWPREAFSCSEVDCISQSNGLAAGQRSGPIEAALVDRHDVEVVPRKANGIFEIESDDRLVVESIDRWQCFGERHC